MSAEPVRQETAILVQIAAFGGDSTHMLEEFKALVLSAHIAIEGIVTGQRDTPEPKYFVGQGKAEEIKTLVENTGATLVLVNHELSPSQSRNLERFMNARVIDRSELILDIFAQRARTFEGKLQVELAQLEHLSSRLIRGWTHLERQKGGIGLRGPGETQLETDRRLIRARIQYIQKRLEKVSSSRAQNRLARLKSAMKTVSLAGYTNAGKSTLFNQLTDSTVYTADQLFATLDPTMRKLSLPGAHPVILADTVGFIQQLPHQLIDAFKATLEETLLADLLLHVIDIADPEWRTQAAAVETVLAEMGAEHIPRITVYNKIDVHPTLKPDMIFSENGYKVWLSARSGAGIDILKDTIIRVLSGHILEERYTLGPQEGHIRAMLYQLHAVVHETTDPDGLWHIHVKWTQEQKNKVFPP